MHLTSALGPSLAGGCIGWSGGLRAEAIGDMRCKGPADVLEEVDGLGVVGDQHDLQPTVRNPQAHNDDNTKECKCSATPCRAQL
eukprot:118626-Rhodomonas_salina.6